VANAVSVRFGPAVREPIPVSCIAVRGYADGRTQKFSFSGHAGYGCTDVSTHPAAYVLYITCSGQQKNNIVMQLYTKQLLHSFEKKSRFVPCVWGDGLLTRFMGTPLARLLRKLHYFDWLWICCTYNSFVQQIHNQSK